MTAKRVIPCLDVKDGRVVKGINFVNMRDAADPAEAAEVYSREGADELVFLDIMATVEGRGTTLEAVRRVAERATVPLAVGGGIRSVSDVKATLEAGAAKVSMNSAAVKRPELIREAAEEFGSQCVVVAIDAKRKDENSWEVYVDSGRTPTGLDVVEWAVKAESLGAGELLPTSIDRDGTTEGYDVEQLAAVSSAVKIPVIASGGAGSLEHLLAALTEGKADAVLAASVFHFGKFSIGEVKRFLKEHGVPVRI